MAGRRRGSGRRSGPSCTLRNVVPGPRRVEHPVEPALGRARRRAAAARGSPGPGSGCATRRASARRARRRADRGPTGDGAGRAPGAARSPGRAAAGRRPGRPDRGRAWPRWGSPAGTTTESPSSPPRRNTTTRVPGGAGLAERGARRDQRGGDQRRRLPSPARARKDRRVIPWVQASRRRSRLGHHLRRARPGGHHRPAWVRAGSGSRALAAWAARRVAGRGLACAGSNGSRVAPHRSAK